MCAIYGECHRENKGQQVFRMPELLVLSSPKGKATTGNGVTLDVEMLNFAETEYVLGTLKRAQKKLLCKARQWRMPETGKVCYQLSIPQLGM
jgi:hypothetical protein